jgi:hypothetical protein
MFQLNRNLLRIRGKILMLMFEEEKKNVGEQKRKWGGG